MQEEPEHSYLQPYYLLRATLKMLQSVKASPVGERKYNNRSFNIITLVARVIKTDPITMIDGSAIMSFPYQMNDKYKPNLKIGTYVNCVISLRVSNGKNDFTFHKIIEAEPIDITLHMANIIKQQISEQKQKQIEKTPMKQAESELFKIEQWARSQYEFTKDQLSKNFPHLSQQKVKIHLNSLEEASVVFNLGNHYQVNHMPPEQLN